MQVYITAANPTEIKTFKSANPTAVVTRLLTSPDVYCVVSPADVGTVITRLPASYTTGAPVKSPGRPLGKKNSSKDRN